MKCLSRLTSPTHTFECTLYHYGTTTTTLHAALLTLGSKASWSPYHTKTLPLVQNNWNWNSLNHMMPVLHGQISDILSPAVPGPSQVFWSYIPYKLKNIELTCCRCIECGCNLNQCCLFVTTGSFSQMPLIMIIKAPWSVAMLSIKYSHCTCLHCRSRNLKCPYSFWNEMCHPSGIHYHTPFKLWQLILTYHEQPVTCQISEWNYIVSVQWCHLPLPLYIVFFCSFVK